MPRLPNHTRVPRGLPLTSRDGIRVLSDHSWEAAGLFQEGPCLVSQSDGSARRAKRFLSAEQKYDLWLRMLTGQITTVAAAAEAGVDRTTIMTLRKVARDGAIAALQASRPGRPKADRVELSEPAGLRADNTRLTATIVEQAIELAALRGKASWGLNGPIPARVDGAVKTAVLGLIEDAVGAGWSFVTDLWALGDRPRSGMAVETPPGGR